MNGKISLLLVEDETVLAGVVKETLEMKGFSVMWAANGHEGMALYRSKKPDVCVIDVMMPKKDGITLVTEIRQTDTRTPIVFLTAKGEVQDVLKGFLAGADDYIKKPFSIEELILRLLALVKRSGILPELQAPDGLIWLGSYLFDHLRQELRLGDHVQHLSQRESDILKMLADNRNGITSRKDMLLALWGDDSFFNARNMDVYITRMRKYLRGDESIQIMNVRGRGFKLVV